MLVGQSPWAHECTRARRNDGVVRLLRMVRRHPRLAGMSVDVVVDGRGLSLWVSSLGSCRGGEG